MSIQRSLSSLGLLSLLALLGCNSSKPAPTGTKPSTDGKDRVVLMLNWYPEAEHGGFYAAQVHGIFEQFGLQVEIRAGGPTAPVAQELVAGRVQFAIGNADDVLVFRQQKVPVVALMAPIQNTPRCIMVHADSAAQSLSDLKGMLFQAGAGRPYLSFMQSRGLLEGVQIVPYSGVPKFVTDKNSAIQAYSFSEPLLAKQQGVEVRTLMLSDIGFNPYASCLMATDDYVSFNEDVVSRMVVACREGWKKYFESPDATNKTILAANQFGMTMETLEFGVRELRPLCLPDGLLPEDIGTMSQERWTNLLQQFTDLKLVDASVTVDKVFTRKFVDRSAPTEL